MLSTLFIRNLELPLFLGWPVEERSQQQMIHVDIDIQFPKPPLACQTDQLNDTVCYAALVQLIQTQMAIQSFRLIEHVAYQIYQLIKPHLPDQTSIVVRITKYPPIAGLTGGVSFSYADAG